MLPCITQKLPGFELNKFDLNIPNNVRLADPEFQISKEIDILGVQLCFRRFPIDGFSGKWWSK